MSIESFPSPTDRSTELSDFATSVEQSTEQPTLFGRLQQFRQDHPVIATVTESVAGYAARRVIMSVVNDHSDLKIGHGRQSHLKNTHLRVLQKHPIILGSIYAGLAPALEEFVFRKLPSDRLDKQAERGVRWDVGTIVGLGFMAAHVGKDAVPVPQGLAGLDFWRLQRTRGYQHAVLGHVINNGLAAVMALKKPENRAVVKQLLTKKV